ncbi:hypothetical protein EST38_g14208 [Candolleomyces aberdarensis]|uniref:Uncharacterized protein n=1 Tax=Candolleomyces aberdarensis TaxID=2316362 RepID=A0A4Q2CXV9_9AGAR|nr:hypothetical protein EST38_g14208 [Candolleomyces aberdarensis]
MAPKANKNPAANSFAAIAPKDTKDQTLTTTPTATKTSTNANDTAATLPPPQSAKRRVEDVEAPEPSPSPSKKAAREDDMDTDNPVEEMFSPQTTPKPATTAPPFTTWDPAVPRLAPPPNKGKGKEKATGQSPSDFDIFLSREDTQDPEIEALESASLSNQEQTVELPLPPLEMGVIPSLPASRLTPTPQGGFPKIYGTSLKRLAGNITKDTKEVWETLATPLVLITVAYAKPLKEFSMTYISRLSAAITSVIGKTEDLIISPSEPNQADTLTDKQCWSTPDLTFFAWPTTIPVSTYLMTLTGILIPASPENEAYVAGVVRKRLLESPKFNTWILADNN